ncbi:MAG: MFS transporter [Slackia piriformis]|uniref:Multidrug efflux pump Tap n=1 Tax=Slackia piriformis TaxID=626934 RepID=A0A943YYG8_9ACTN|nr:MFS transporter [Slackia piriformis]
MTKLRATVPFVASNALSLLGNSIAGVVLPLVLLAKTGDALAAGTLAIVCALPQILAGLLGGALLDRFNRRDLSVLSDLVSAASIAALPLIDATVGLSFGWFVACGIVGAIGDVPGMTARDTLLPAVVSHDGLDLQRFMGVTQSIEGLTVIAGPAVASLGMGFLGAANTLWLTAALSVAAAATTLFVPRVAGMPPLANRAAAPKRGMLRAAADSTKEGVRVLFRSDAVLRSSVVLGLLIVTVMGSYQGMVLPVFFTQQNAPALLGYVLSAMSVGALAGSLLYARFAPALKRRTWYVLSFAGMAAGVAALGSLFSYEALFAGAALLGFASGPASALLGYYMYGLIPDEHRGAALGTQNSLMLMVAPVAVFGSSLAIEAMGVAATSLALAAAWLALTVYALATKAMRNI